MVGAAGGPDAIRALVAADPGPRRRDAKMGFQRRAKRNTMVAGDGGHPGCLAI